MRSTFVASMFLLSVGAACSDGGAVRSADSAASAGTATTGGRAGTAAGSGGVPMTASNAQAGSATTSAGAAANGGSAGANQSTTGAAANGSSPGSAANAGSAGANQGSAGAAANGGSTGASAGSAGEGASSSSGIAATFETVKLVFGGGGGITTCAAAPCHGVNGAAPPDDPLELPTNNDDQLYMTLTSYVSRACGGIKLVDPGKPTQSALVTILKGPCGMTPRMPYGCSVEAGDCIPDEYIEAVSQWIASGAPRE